MKNIGGYPWLTLEICEQAKAKVKDSVDDACQYLRVCAAKRGYSLGVKEALDVVNKHCS